MSANTTSATRPGERPQQMQNRAGIEFVWIPPGSFLMGAEIGGAAEKPALRVTIGEGFYRGRHARLEDGGRGRGLRFRL